MHNCAGKIDRKSKKENQLRGFLFVAAALVGVGCTSNSSDVPIVCTQIGCNNGLSVVVTNTLSTASTVTVRAGTQVIATFNCTPGQPCQQFIENQTPAEVSVSVQSTAGTVNRTFQPEYRMNRPNGPNCPPECRQGTVTVNVS